MIAPALHSAVPVQAPPKVLHCVERMHTNAIETWLVRMQRHAHATGRAVDWHYHVQLATPGALETAAPLDVIRSPYPLSRWVKFFDAFRGACMEGRYDVVHIHADLLAAPYAVVARLAGVKRIVVHVHNADEALPMKPGLKRRALTQVFRRIALALADRVVGISNHTLDTFLAGRARRPGLDMVHYYGVEGAPFVAADGDREAFRGALGLAADCRILLFSGRLVPEKNPLFALDVFAEMHRRDPATAMVFAGAGSLEEAVGRRAAEYGLQDCVRQLGWRDDIPAVMVGCDWFILPRPERPMEGFGIAVVEAQLAGLRLLLSEGIADDPLLPGVSYRRLPLKAGAAAWAEAAFTLLREDAPMRSKAARALAASPMDMDRALSDLLALHA